MGVRIEDARRDLEQAILAYIERQERSGVAPLVAEARAQSVVGSLVARRWDARNPRPQKGMSSSSAGG